MFLATDLLEHVQVMSSIPGLVLPPVRGGISGHRRSFVFLCCKCSFCSSRYAYILYTPKCIPAHKLQSMLQTHVQKHMRTHARTHRFLVHTPPPALSGNSGDLWWLPHNTWQGKRGLFSWNCSLYIICTLQWQSSVVVWSALGSGMLMSLHQGGVFDMRSPPHSPCLVVIVTAEQPKTKKEGYLHDFGSKASQVGLGNSAMSSWCNEGIGWLSGDRVGGVNWGIVQRIALPADLHVLVKYVHFLRICLQWSSRFLRTSGTTHCHVLLKSMSGRHVTGC